MKTISGKANVSIEFNITLSLTNEEAQALVAIAGYGSDEFLKTFYQHMGRTRLEPYESEMRKLFDKIRNELPIEISKIETAEKSITEALSTFK